MIGVTGANGYIGGRVLAHLRAAGVEALAMVRRPSADAQRRPGDLRARRFALAEPLEPTVLEGIETVVHAAWDLSSRGRQIHAVNVDGSLPLLDGLASHGRRVVLVSSLAAFEGARSLYGRAKLELERAVLARGGVVLRPGVVFGVDAGGLFGTLARVIGRRPLVPLAGGGWQRLFVTHDRQLCELIAAVAVRRFDAERPVFAAHEVPTTLRAIAAQLARVHGRRLRVLPLPPRLAYLGLRGVESAGLALPFRSDSLLSLINPAPLDQLAGLQRSPLQFPPLTPELWSPARQARG